MKPANYRRTERQIPGVTARLFEHDSTATSELLYAVAEFVSEHEDEITVLSIVYGNDDDGNGNNYTESLLLTYEDAT